MKMKPVLVAIAGDRDLRLLKCSAPSETPAALHQLGADDFADVHADFAGGRGRGQSGGGGGTHGYDAHHSEAEMERGRFAHHAADVIAAEWIKAAKGALLLVAGPKMLGLLRDALVARDVSVAGELGKDLVKVPPHGLPEHLDAELRRIAASGL